MNEDIQAKREEIDRHCRKRVDEFMSRETDRVARALRDAKQSGDRRVLEEALEYARQMQEALEGAHKLTEGWK